ncbi:DUF3320 domain-containing protein [Pelagibacterium sp. 26DY04]|uniref:DUF3320 domain-containing protein n=1 Tax=Pelagibacterium sp. 26DY04 TaxID=2967130 RepID=UPI00281664CE|nr:DUF3320 domain-containing protein [Pelagibacterium sp. 26DY04]WMT87483.1 DUF3320 domain-containing protein [Pelagibacterium sp. 26DY04]
MSAAEIDDLIRSKIENLRPKLLDLGRRNPLIATKLSTRSNSLVRVVDGIPEVIRFNLSNGVPMRFAPLPPLEEDPRDEDTDAFQDALSSARLSDDTYRSALDAIDVNRDDSEEIARRVERDLKDRVRLAIGLPQRQHKSDLSLQDHATINGISPHWDLPAVDSENEGGRHTDDSIQTLMLPNDLERKLNALTTKCKTWQQETGINVLHAAFGFIEWKEPNSTTANYSPLILLPVQIEKKKTRDGAEFWISAEGDDADANFVFAEKMRLQFSIDIPSYHGGSVEDYFAEVAETAPKTMPWKVRRQVAIGVFPSARMAMYRDLDTTNREFENNSVIATLFGGSEVESSTPFADEYDVDDPTIEVKAPYLVTDADSSQFSTIVDVTDGKNLAVEGPPGTGKSQTIVNTIANALGQGKKVLFIAEKMAALEVVKSRLEAVGLGEFVLPLQADRSSREQVVSSIRRRIGMEPVAPPRDYQNRIERFRHTRSELAAYIEAISAPFGNTGRTVHDVLGKGIATSHRLDGLPREFRDPQIAGLEELSPVDLEMIMQKAEALSKASEAALDTEPYWDGLEVVHLDKFQADDLKRLAEDASGAFAQAAASRSKLPEMKIASDNKTSALRRLFERLDALQVHLGDADHGLVVRVAETATTPALLEFLEQCGAYQKQSAEIAALVSPEGVDRGGAPLRELAGLCSEHDFDSLDAAVWESDLNRTADEIASLQDAFSKLKQFVDYFPQASTFPLATLAKAGEIVRSTDHDVLAARSEATADPAASTIISRLCQSGRELQDQQERLNATISTTTDFGVSQLREYADTIERAGVMRLFSSSFHAAKKAFLSISKDTRFDKALAAHSLQSLGRWKEAMQRYGDDHQARALFGLHFRGIETDFYLFESLCEYYQRIEAAFPGPAHRDIRALLKSGDLDLIAAIPDIQAEDNDITFEALQAEILTRLEKHEAAKDVFRKATALVASLRQPIDLRPADLDSLADQLDSLEEQRHALDHHVTGRETLGERFAGAATNPEDFVAEVAALRLLIEAGEDAGEITRLIRDHTISDAKQRCKEVLDHDAMAENALAMLADKAGDTIAEEVGKLPARQAADYLAKAAQDQEGMHIHSRFATACKEIEDLGFAWVLDVFEDNDLGFTQFAEILEAIVFRAKTRLAFESHGSVLASFSGTKLDTLRKDLARLDNEIIQLTRQHLRSTISRAAKPPYGNGRGKRSTFTQLALLENEIAKKQRFLPVRELTRRADRALLEMKPCWMMSPLAVAQYLSPNMEFDLCIIDEASQMPPEDAVGALYRSKQTMVVGDTNQLPPTSFFKKMLEDDEADEDEVVEDESVLEMANAVFRPARRLRWHYRSKHSGLIQFSNEHVYDNNLIVFPSPREAHPQMGVSLVPVVGNYKSGVNSEEARTMIDAALQFMRSTPNRSLGLVTLNQKQRDLLLEEWDRTLNRDTTAARYVDDWLERNDGLEQFFIKNLENVQGDERDAIFISTVYGPERPGGPVMQRFGPISGLAGKRRLNVLFSRAKEQIVTFSSMTASDIRADESSNPGAFMLKRWLEYSATGVIHAGDYSDREPDSDFEIFVMEQLRAMGCIPVPQVGVAKFRIDIGVKHPDWPHGFIMGVECDGATYHSSRSARDRDRLREKVLTDLGWHLHRIWSTDWFLDPRKEAERMREAVVARLAQLKETAPSAAPIAAFTPASATQEEEPPVAAMASQVVDEPEVISNPDRPQPAQTQSETNIVEAGDTVQVRYLDGDKSVREVQLSSTLNDPSRSIVHIREPLGRALLGAEIDEEIEVLIGNHVRPAVVERIVKPSFSETGEGSGPSIIEDAGEVGKPRTNSRVTEAVVQDAILRLLSDGEVRTNANIKDSLRKSLPLTAADRERAAVRINEERWEALVNNALSPSRGNSLTSRNLVEPVQLGHHRITSEGRATLGIGNPTLSASPVPSSSETPSAMPQTTLFPDLKKRRIADGELRPDEFYQPHYLDTLRVFAINIVDDAGPITFRHLSEIIARAHGFQRTGSQIKRQVWAAISKARTYSAAPNGEKIFWAENVHPSSVVKFRGMQVAGHDREWQHIPHPERLGLALELIERRVGGDLAAKMADRVGFSRLRQTTREEMEVLIAEAKAGVQRSA